MEVEMGVSEWTWGVCRANFVIVFVSLCFLLLR